MGLDMYLFKVKKNKDMPVDEITYGDEIAYWRKANQIHNWFVNNVQNKNDDCRTYNVSEQKLTDLLNTCKLVSMSCNLIKGKVERGQEFKDGKLVPIIGDGMVIEDKTVAEKLLPTQSGFFFGSTQYDEWYLETIQDTINQIDQILDTTDFDTECILYHASW